MAGKTLVPTSRRPACGKCPTDQTSDSDKTSREDLEDRKKYCVG
jgi:hypothetical protein